ncbi:hypothetical protein [Falsiroseomonas sp. E2-1-a4]|uniref:hypothetical protein n=1 Tax=Falsiroseomonas sp. E2-1-a4 TaxID=3239299 RepID=UPI003F39312D
MIRQSPLLLASVVLIGCAAEGPARPATTATAAPTAQVQTGPAAFVGRWTGYWGGNAESTLIVESISPAGEAVGSYQFMQTPPSRFQAPIEGNAFGFGSTFRFTFRLLPDGRMSGERRRPDGLVDTIRLSRI